MKMQIQFNLSFVISFFIALVCITNSTPNQLDSNSPQDKISKKSRRDNETEISPESKSNNIHSKDFDKEPLEGRRHRKANRNNISGKYFEQISRIVREAPESEGAKAENGTNDDSQPDGDHDSHPKSKKFFGGLTDDDYYKEELDPETSPGFTIKYLDETEIANHILKHSTMYRSKFYPPWSYYGFYPPTEWHKVPIEYFTRPTKSKINTRVIKNHQSAMWICSAKVTNDRKKCEAVMENECRNEFPSPIDIITAEAKDIVLPDGTFIFRYFDVFFGFNLIMPDDGTDMIFLTFLVPEKNADRIPAVSSGTVGDFDLYLDRIAFNFGRDPQKGSEHSIDGKYFGMEIQLYFTADKVSYWESAAKQKFMKRSDNLYGNNVHVFSVMVKVGTPGAKKPGEKREIFSERFEAISKAVVMFWESTNQHKYRGVQLSKKLISLEDFLGVPLKGQYYTYEGSLSTPPCLKPVKRTIFEKPIWITHEQWMRFSLINSEYSDAKYLAGNLRFQSEITLDVGIPKYLEMRKVEGLRELSRFELDELIQYKMIDSEEKDESDSEADESKSQEEEGAADEGTPEESKSDTPEKKDKRRKKRSPNTIGKELAKNNSLNIQLYVTVQYTSFRKYFARRVQKPKLSNLGGRNMDEDYYDAADDKLDTNKGNSMYFHFTPKLIAYYIAIIIIFM